MSELWAPPVPPPLKMESESGEIDKNGLEIEVDVSFADDMPQWSCAPMNASFKCKPIPANESGCPQVLTIFDKIL